MKTKLSKRLIALVLSVLFIIAFGAIGLAANTDDAWNNYNGVESTDTTISIAKQIVFINAEDDTSVREPNITYVYTISAAALTADKTATVTGVDSTGAALTVDVKPGVMAAVTGADTATTSQVAFSDLNYAEADSDGNGMACIKYADFDFDPDDFTAAGIYRYKIAESLLATSNTKDDVGVAETTTYSDTRYLDVYVRLDTDSNPEIYGFVLFDDDFDTSIEYDDDDDLDLKSAGFVNTSDLANGDAPANVDVYETSNLTVNKTITGSLADKGNDFPLAITFTKAAGLADGIKLDFTTASNGVLTKTGTDTNNVDYVTMDDALDATVEDGSTITITGIPVGSSVVIVETNNTANAYRVKAGTSADDDDLLAEDVVDSLGTSGNITTGNNFDTTAIQEIYITNTLDEISPTGVVLYFAPYLLTLGVAVALIIGARRFRRVRVEEE